MHEQLQKIKQIAEPILKQNGVEFAGVFGSVARGEDRPDSDVDLLVKFSGMPTFSGYLLLDKNLKLALGRDVDLITVGGLNKYLRPQIERDLKIIYGQRPNLS